MSLTTITRSKPFYVVAGAGDLAVKTVRRMPSRLVTIKVERKDVAKAVATLQAETSALPGKAQSAAVGVAVGAADRADAVYDTLLTRGRKVVGRIRRQKSTQELKRNAGTTVRRTKAASTVASKGASDTASAAKGTRTTAKKSTRKTASATRTSAKRTATTARKRATGTRTATKSAATSAAKTTESAAQAISDGAAKVGS
jgi:heparin binding hemagglutinin HbhA